MALHPSFPSSPHEILDPAVRWFPAAEEMRETAYEKLLPPLVANVRQQVDAWRTSGYKGASDTSKALLQWWFDTHHLVEQADSTQSEFRYYFAQREAVESVIWLHDVRKARDKYDLLRFDASGAVSSNMFDEEWPRFVVKMATGAGNGEISEASSGKSKDELELLRKQSNEIDTWKSPYKAIVSVLMLKEGWDVRNVSVIVGLRAYTAKSNILPEQTLGRGLRRMYFGSEQREYQP